MRKFKLNLSDKTEAEPVADMGNTMTGCKHEFVDYKQCCYCGAFESYDKRIIDKRIQANVEDLRQSFIEWYAGVKETNGGYTPLAMQIFYWFEHNVGIFDNLTKSPTPSASGQAKEEKDLLDFYKGLSNIHICKKNQLIKNYGTLVCSMCRQGEGINLLIEKENVERFAASWQAQNNPENEAIEFAEWLDREDYKTGAERKNWYKWNGMDCMEVPYTTSQLYEIFRKNKQQPK